MTAHALFAPSSAHRVVLCPASLKLSMDRGNSESVAAAEGSVAHHLAEWCMNNRAAPSTRYGDMFYYMGHGVIIDDPIDGLDAMFEFRVDDEMVSHITSYIAHCYRRPGKKFVEVRVNISEYTPIPDQFGTSDHVAVDVEGGTLYVDDLKYGKGVYVAPKDNWQAISYALGVLTWLRLEHPKSYAKIKRVVIGIYQPRIDNIDEWVTTKEHVLKLGEFLKERYALAWGDNAPFGPEAKACQWCPVTKCRAQRDHLAAMMPDIDVDEKPTPEEISRVYLSDEEAAKMWLQKSWYEHFFNALHAYLFKQVTDGIPNELLRLGEGRGTRVWKSEAAAKHLLREFKVHDIVQSKIISPAQAEKKLKKPQREELKSLIQTIPGAPRLVPMGSKHRDYGSQVRDAMPDLDDEFGIG